LLDVGDSSAFAASDETLGSSRPHSGAKPRMNR